MEKNLVIAIILSVVIVVGSVILNNTLNLRKAESTPIEANRKESEEASERSKQLARETHKGEIKVVERSQTEFSDQDHPEKEIKEKTDLYQITFSTVGGVIKELNLLQELDDNQPIPMVLDNKSGVGTFNISFGGPESEYIKDTFSHERKVRRNRLIHIFSRDFTKDNQIFTLTKTYTIIPGEYIVELLVSLSTPDGSAVPFLNPDEPAYTLTYGPQIGPYFEKIDGRYEIRENVSWGPDPKNGKIKRVVHKPGRRDESKTIQTANTLAWAAIIGKYFGVLVDPGSGRSIITWNGSPADGQQQANRLQISKPSRRLSFIEDKFLYYIGPLDRKILARYDDPAMNAFGISSMGLGHAPRSSSLFGWLQKILQFFLEQFHKLIPNYGVAIILLTILVKAVLFPFTRKSFHSTSRMQTLQPRIKELQEQYKGDPRTLNAKTAELYKSEGINPLGGCLPLLLQLPVFLALYNLLNQYFPLRGATFISGWIEDLSAPDAIVQFENGLNFLGVNYDAIRLLPILNLLGQILSTRVTQKGSNIQSSGSPQKMLMFIMPLMIFFLFYNVPSGLLVYWTSMNLITIGQQLFINYTKNKKSATGGNK